MKSQLSPSNQTPERINFSRKFFVHGDVLMITSRVEDGLPFPPNDLINSLTLGILARAQELYPVQICHYIFLSNHFHLIVRVISPEDVPKFVGYLKGEMAHVVNRLLGRRRKTIFNREYDSPKFLTPEDVKKYIKYLYLNPATANLESSIDKYPGLNSWLAFKGKKRFIQARKVSRREIRPLPTSSLSITESSKLSDYYMNEAKGRSCVLQITPDVWAEKRLTVICSNLRLRIDYLTFYKELCVEAREIYRKWKTGLTKLSMPPGMFPPATPVLAWAIPPST